MRACGASTEDVAKYAYGASNELKMKYKDIRLWKCLMSLV